MTTSRFVELAFLFLFRVRVRAEQAAIRLILGTKPEGFVTGHDFSRAVNAAKSTWALQAAEKLLPVKGTGFSPYINPAK
jgi:hypothetical protein